MWTISGPFDVEKPTSKDPTVIAQVYSTSKFKLLKTGKAYTLGRRNAELQIDWAKISKKHGLFTVGAMSTADVENPAFRPTLTLKNLREEKKQTIGVIRNGSELTLNINMDLELQHGDVVRAVGDIRLTVCWQEICCYSAPSRVKSTFSLDACASLGIHLVKLPHESITHYMTSAFSLDAPSAMSLLSGQKFVQPGWLTELLRLGELQPSEPQSLEWVCEVPKETKFRPTFHVSLPPDVKKFDLWLPNKERANLLQGINFLLAGKESASDMQEAIIKGGGTADTMDYDVGNEERRKMMRAVSKKGKRGVVFVASEGELKKALGQDTWSEFVNDASSCGQKFCDPSLVVQAIVQMHTDNLLTSSKEAAGSHYASHPPEGAPNTYADEPSYPPDEDSQSKHPARKLVRRARDPTLDTAGTLTSAVAASAVPPEDDVPPAPRRKLVRRAKQAPIIGIDDPSIVEEDPPVDTTMEAPAMPPTAQAPATTRTSRLKRRAGTNLTSVARSPSPPLEAPSSTQPKLKKFKALFEESDPDRLAQSQLEEGSGAVINTQMMQSLGFDQSAFRIGTGSTFGVNTMVTNGTSGSLTQDETQAPAPVSARESDSGRIPSLGSGRIGGLSILQEEEEVQGIIEPMMNESHSAGPSSPRKHSGNAARSEEVEETVPQSPRKKVGAEPGKHDTDVAFLKALATKKTGGKKGGEDTFDREFNNLRISKPELERETKSERQEDEWRMLADFGDDTNVRGNFMVVIPMDVPERDTNIRRRRNDTRPEWEGKADFKKFRRKLVLERRAPVTLILSGPPDGGIGPAYWPKVTHTEFQSQLDEANLPSKQESSPPPSPPKPRPRPKKREYTELSDVSDEESSEPVVKSRRTTRQPSLQPSRAGSAVPTAASKQPITHTTRSKGGAAQQTPLFIESDDDGSNGKNEDFQMDDNETEDFADQLAAVPEDEDEDEAPSPRKGRSQTAARSQTAKASAAKKPTKKPAAPVVNDDSDDGVAFKGFGSRTQTRKGGRR